MSLDADPETLADIFAAITRQAIADHLARWSRPGYPSAYAYLTAAGLVRPDGTLGTGDIVIDALPNLPRRRSSCSSP